MTAKHQVVHRLHDKPASARKPHNPAGGSTDVYSRSIARHAKACGYMLQILETQSERADEPHITARQTSA